MRRFPALVAAVTGNDGAVLGVQRTWLDPRRPAKAGIPTTRKALGRIFGHAVRFGAVRFDTVRFCAVPADGPASLVVGEGIETVLSLIAAVPEIGAAAALSAGSLGAFAPPPGVARLVIARDNDEDGALAAERLARRLARAGVAVTIIVPIGNDFNDDLASLGAPALRARLAPLFRFAGEGGERRVGQAVTREEGGHGRHRQPETRTQAPRGIRIRPCAQQHRADRSPHQMGQSVQGGVDGSRDEAIARYRADLWRRIRSGEIALEELADIAGCWYACHCAPSPCHGEVLARAAAWAAGVLAECDTRQADG